MKRETLFEFYLTPSFRGKSSDVFSQLLDICKAEFIESQSNDVFLTSLLYQYGSNISSDVILFGDESTSHLQVPGTIFRKRSGQDHVFEHSSEPVGDYVLEKDRTVAATGGFLLHYNFPFADLYMEVESTCRRKGLGSFLIQELKRECYLAGRTPAARCNKNNIGSQATLIKAGLKPVGKMLKATVNR